MSTQPTSVLLGKSVAKRCLFNERDINEENTRIWDCFQNQSGRMFESLGFSENFIAKIVKYKLEYYYRKVKNGPIFSLIALYNTTLLFTF